MRRAAPALTLVYALSTAVAWSSGCGDDPDAPPSGAADAPATERDPGPPAQAEVEAFVAAPDYPTLIRFLGQDHASARERLGPHRIRYNATITTGPAGLDPSAPVPDVPADRPIVERFAVTDVVELVWGSRPGEPARLSLDQHNEHEHGRALILIDERAWTNLDGRGWFERPLDSDLWELWTDDVQHAVLDLVELAGPHADIGAIRLEELGGRPAVRVSLQPSEQQHPDRTVDGLTPWRHDAKVQVVSASIVLDRETGLWRQASVELAWTFQDSAQRELSGRARFEGSVDVLAQAPAILPPTDSRPLPERDRPELLRERLLDGLAGP